MTLVKEDEAKLQFRGSNWEDLDRLVGLARFRFLQDDDYDDNEPRRCGYVAESYAGPALDWVTSTFASEPNLFDNFDQFINRTKETFGVESLNIQALRRQQLDALKWGKDVPVFFSEFDRLTRQLNLTSDQTRIVMVRQKLPLSIMEEFARQSLDFTNYDTMRERLNTMWALDPHRDQRKEGEITKKPRCGSCGKKGHVAANCTKPKN
jgi:hypothetical protein